MPRPTRLSLTRLEDRTAPAVFTVTTAADNGVGSLRAAVALANADQDPDTITFAPTLAGATVGLITAGDTTVGPSALRVSSPVTIRGSGQTVARVGGAPFRLFFVDEDGLLTMDGLTLTGGLAEGAAGTDGGGGGGGGGGFGGAVFNRGVLTVLNSTLTGNSAVGGRGGAGGEVYWVVYGGAGGGAGGFGGGGGGGQRGRNADPLGGPVGMGPYDATNGSAGLPGGFGGGGGGGGAGGSGASGGYPPYSYYYPGGSGAAGGGGGFAGGAGGGGGAAVRPGGQAGGGPGSVGRCSTTAGR